MKNTEKKIVEKIEKARAKTIFFTDDFRNYGTPEAVKIALHRLVRRNILSRMGRGIYVKPDYSKLLDKEVLPAIEEVAMAIAKRDQAKIIPTGSYALYALGLSTQVPMKIVYLTDGSPRKIKIGEAYIWFKRTSTKTLSLKGKISTLAIQALKEIGKDQLREEEEKKIIDILKNEDYKKLKYDISIAPQWIAEIMAKSLSTQ